MTKRPEVIISSNEPSTQQELREDSAARPIALITGGSKRIGRGFALAFAKAGYDVWIHYNSAKAEVAETAADIEALGSTCLTFQADLAAPTGAENLISQLERQDGQVPTVLINNASIFRDDDAVNFTTENLELHMNVHVRVPMLLSQWLVRAAEGLASRTIINMVDQRVLNPSAAHYTYAVSKHALWAATQQMARDFAPKIRVNAIAPGPVLPPPGSTGVTFHRQQEAMPLNLGPTVEEIANTAIYLVNSPSVTGSIIAVDGGQHLGYMNPGEAARYVNEGVRPG